LRENKRDIERGEKFLRAKREHISPSQLKSSIPQKDPANQKTKITNF
jgi:hypothetical protein